MQDFEINVGSRKKGLSINFQKKNRINCLQSEILEVDLIFLASLRLHYLLAPDPRCKRLVQASNSEICNFCYDFMAFFHGFYDIFMTSYVRF